MKLLYLCEADTGGIARYGIEQFSALLAEGVEARLLCRPSLPIAPLDPATVLPLLPRRARPQSNRLCRPVQAAWDFQQVAIRTRRLVREGPYDALLIACFVEYFAPFWAPLFRSMAKSGLVIGVVAHDPVRNYVVGPGWWHRWSIRQAYSFCRLVFVHDQTPVDFGGAAPAGIGRHIIPHGPYDSAGPIAGHGPLRKSYGFEATDTVFLAFGQIRDGKNLDLFLRALVDLPATVKLLVAGSPASEAQKPVDHYQRLARDLGVADRCVWDIRYIPDEETGAVFAASDYILLTYHAHFRSSSGVLKLAVSARRPVLASAGRSPLQTEVETYDLGVFVPPDNQAALLDGARALLSGTLPEPQYARCLEENSWQENARRVIKAFAGCLTPPAPRP